jgi:hypothetical protein
MVPPFLRIIIDTSSYHIYGKCVKIIRRNLENERNGKTGGNGSKDRTDTGG